jgi:hypothetical protein
MPTKRTPRNRDRNPPISPEALAEFVALSKVPKRQRDVVELKAREKALHRMLGLGGEWLCDVCSVFDAGRVSHRTGFHHESWLKVRAVRLRLLALAGMSEKQAG